MDVFDLFAKISIDTSEYERGLNDASGKTSSFGDKLKSGLATAAKVGAAAVATATTAATAFAASSVKTGMTFDSSMSQVMATMGYSVDELNDKSSEASQTMDTLRNFAMEMSSSTSFSASQVADSLNYMALAGYDAETSMDMLPTVLNLAAAGSIDLASASDMVTDAQSALGLTLDETVTMVDQMAMASSKSNTSVAQLGEAILTVGGTAQNLAGGTTELSTALGILADSGIKGAEGGTHLRNVILSLTAPTDTAAVLMEKLGVSAYDTATGQMRPLNETLGDLNDALSDMTQGEQINAINTIFNKTDIAAVNALLAGTGERWDELSGYIDNATDSAQNMAEVQLDNLAGDITLFQSALEGAQIVLSDQLTPTLREFVQFGSDAISTLSTAFQEGGLTGAMEALGTILSDGLNMVIEQLPKMVDAGMQLLGALGQGLLDNLPVITDAAVEIVLMLANGIIEGLPALAEGAVQIVTELATGIGEALPELIPKAYEAVYTFAASLTSPESINSLLDAAVDLITGLIQGLANAVPIIVEYGPEIIANLVMGIISAIPRLIEVGGQLIMGLIDGLIQGVLAIPEAIAKVVSAIVDGFKALFGIHSPSTVFAEMGGFLIEGLLQGISGAWQAIVDFFGGAAEALINFLGGAWDTIKNAASAAWTAIGDALGAAWDFISGIWDGAVSFFGGIWDGISGFFSGAAEWFGGIFSGAWEAVTSAWDGAMDFFGGIWESITGVFGNAWDTFKEIGGNIINGIWDGVTGLAGWLWDNVSGFFGNFVDGVKDFFGIHSPSTVFAEIGGYLIDGLAGGMDDKDSALSEQAAATMDAIMGVFGGMPDMFSGVGENAMSALSGSLGGAISALQSRVANLMNSIAKAAKAALGIHSPSKVFSDIGENMALGLGVGWDDEYDSIKKQITNGLDFGTANVGIAANGAYNASGMAQNDAQAGFGGGGNNTYVTINSPIAVDAVTAAREWKKTTQRMAMGYGV